MTEFFSAHMGISVAHVNFLLASGRDRSAYLSVPFLALEPHTRPFDVGGDKYDAFLFEHLDDSLSV